MEARTQLADARSDVASDVGPEGHDRALACSYPDNRRDIAVGRTRHTAAVAAAFVANAVMECKVVGVLLAARPPVASCKRSVAHRVAVAEDTGPMQNMETSTCRRRGTVVARMTFSNMIAAVAVAAAVG